MKYLFILNDPPYGTERSYNGLRLADRIIKTDEAAEVTVFLMADAVGCARAGQKTPDGFYNLERMLRPILRKGEVLLCGTCMDARGLTDDELMEGPRRSSMVEEFWCSNPPTPKGGWTVSSVSSGCPPRKRATGCWRQHSRKSPSEDRKLLWIA
jgi:uncharacterized protein involved in oxidation of intracellular sulfur